VLSLPRFYQVFHAGPSKQMHWITTAGNGSIVASIRRGDDEDAMNGNAVMYDIGKILTIGGAQNYDSGAASNRAYMIDINGSEATVKRTDDMQFARALVNSVVLPNGEVVVIGGQTAVKLFSDDNHVLEAEIWSPRTETFRTLTPMRVPRTYHSVALLMKDGRVWTAGTNHCWCCRDARRQRSTILSFLQGADSATALPIIGTLKS
jgi:galactose oxidase